MLNTGLSNLIRKTMHGKFPWKAWSSSQDIDSQHDRIIACGNKYEREIVEEYRAMDSLNTCDCCGASLIEHPWARTYGICKGCQEYYAKQNKLLGWQFKPERIDRSAFRPI